MVMRGKSWSCAWLLICLGSVVAGCGPSGPSIYPVTGKVKFNGAPVAEGSITFEDSTTGVAQKADFVQGSYQVELQEGSYKVCVEPIMVDKAPPGGAANFVYKPAADIPKKYHSTFESGLTHNVTAASTYDVDMKR